MSSALKISPRRDTRDVRGVVMAGGRSERMRATNGPIHKALVEVAGVTLLEHNLIRLFASGIKDAVVAISAHEPALDAFLKDRGTLLAREFGAQVQTFVEFAPLGNIGAVGAINDGERDMLVTFVDNLTTLALDELIGRHRSTSAALTIATHLWALRNPFGELDLEAGYVRGYQEKPLRNVRISSGTCIVSPAAAALMPHSRHFGATDLCAAVLAARLPVAAYEHNALWIDVNDAFALGQAEALVQANPRQFA